MDYNYNLNTLIHSIGFNFCALESIFQNGILSYNKALELGVNYSRNYFGYNLDDTISCIRYSYINSEVDDSSYSRYTKCGVSLIIEDVAFIYNKNERIIHRADEVLVSDYISSDKIKGIIVPSSYSEATLDSLTYLPLDSTSYINIKNKCAIYLNYLKTYGHEVKIDDLNIYLRELYLTNNAILEISKNSSDLKNDLDYLDLVNDFKDVIGDLNDFIGMEFQTCFNKFFKKDNVNVLDMVSYINYKYKKLNIYDLPFESRKNANDR